MRGVVIGGIGGGGDAGLSLIIKEALNLKVDYVLSFLNCPSKRLPSIGERAYKGLWRVTVDDHPRLFEGKIRYVDPEIEKAYAVCTRESWPPIEKGLRWLMGREPFDLSFHADLGGDALIMGYEENLGSYKTDTLGKAALSWLAKEYGVKTILGVGNAGAEAWSLEELGATLEYLAENDAYLGFLEVSKENLMKARLLNALGKSGMLPLFIKAVEGARVISEDLYYLKPPIRVEPWYRYVLFFDVERLCELSPLCVEAMRRWHEGIRKWKRPPRPKELQKLFEHYARLKEGSEDEVRKRILEVIESRRFRAPRHANNSS